MSQQEKFVVLWSWEGGKRVQFFSDLMQEIPWSPGTAVSYYETFLGTQMALKQAKVEIAIEPIDQVFLRRLRSRHNTAHPQLPSILTPPEIALMMLQLGAMSDRAALEMKVALGTAYTTIQRLPDVLQVCTTDVRQIGDLIAVTITSGKVVDRIGAYSIHLEAESDVGKALWELAKYKAKQAEENLFLRPEKLLAKFNLVKPAGSGERAVRKGAAIAAAVSGSSVDQIQTQMQHTSRARTLQYLGMGQWNVEQGKECVAMARRVGLQGFLQPQSDRDTSQRSSKPTNTPSKRSNTSSGKRKRGH